jgi:hypothetical protein
MLSFRRITVVALAGAAAWGGWPRQGHAAPESAGASAGPAEPRKRPWVTADKGLPIPGQLSSLFRIDDADPESTVPTPHQRDGNPIEFGYYLQDLMAKAEAATKKNDQDAYIRYMRALAVSVPNHAKGWSLLCEAYERANDRQRAIAACRYAIDREGVQLADYNRFVHLLATKAGELDRDERAALVEVLAHLDRQADVEVATARMRCEAAVKMQDQAAMERCTAVLAKVAPDDPKTIVFQWSLAMMRGKHDDAKRLVARAKTAGLTAEAIDGMNKLMSQRRWSRQLLGFGALGTVAAALLFLLLRRRLDARRVSAARGA